MNSMKRVNFDLLPLAATADVGKENFLYAYYLPEKNRYVIHRVNQTTKDGEEFEFDVAANRFLSVEERQKELPGSDTKVYSDKDLVAYATYQIRRLSNELWTHFDIYSIGEAEKIAEVDQHVYSPRGLDIGAVVSAAVDKAKFPKQYAGWDENRKIRYWAAMIHRFRRWNGESDIDEDEVFAPSLLSDMEKTDPNVRLLLREILSLAAQLEQTEPEVLIRSFSDRVGIKIP